MPSSPFAGASCRSLAPSLQDAHGDAPALTPLSLQGEVGSPGQPGLPGPKVGALGYWDGLCASTWGLRDPCAPQPGAARRMLHSASRPFPHLVAGRCWHARRGWPPWPGGLPRATGRSIRPRFPKAPPPRQAGHPSSLQGHQPKSAPSSQNPPFWCFRLFPCPGTELTACQSAHAAWDPIPISLLPCSPSPSPLGIPPRLAAWTLQAEGGGLAGFTEPQAGGVLRS